MMKDCLENDDLLIYVNIIVIKSLFLGNDLLNLFRYKICLLKDCSQAVDCRPDD